MPLGMNFYMIGKVCAFLANSFFFLLLRLLLLLPSFQYTMYYYTYQHNRIFIDFCFFIATAIFLV